MLAESKIRHLEKFAAQIRLETLKEFKELGFGHVGGSMSIVELLAVLYGGIMNVDPANPSWGQRDWLVLSKGHAGPALYATLALKGFFPIGELSTLNKPGTRLPSHCDRNLTAGVDMTTGSLGQGISTAIGIALGHRLDRKSSYTYVVLGDGECNEGQIWEGVLFAAHHKVDNLLAFVDYNKQQGDGYTKDVMDLGDLAQKFSCFGWHAQEVDGHDVAEIHQAILQAKDASHKPSVIILHTQKGRGCTFAENFLDNHNMTFESEQIDEAIACAKKHWQGLQM
jgi:transketolase